MVRKERKELQKRVLDALLETYRADGIAAMIVPERENGIADTLTVQYTETGTEADDILGRYSFLNAPDTEPEPAAQMFLCELSLSDELRPDQTAELAAVTEKINYFLPFGSFLLTPDRTMLSYRYTALLPADEDEAGLTRMALHCIAQTTQAVLPWADILDDIKYGRRSLEEFAREYAAIARGRAVSAPNMP